MPARRLSERRVPPRGDREPSGCGPLRGRRDLQLRDQSIPGQGAGFSGSLPGPEAGREGDDLRTSFLPGNFRRRSPGRSRRMPAASREPSGRRNTWASWKRWVPERPGRTGEPVRLGIGSRGGGIHREHTSLRGKARVDVRDRRNVRRYGEIGRASGRRKERSVGHAGSGLSRDGPGVLRTPEFESGSVLRRRIAVERSDPLRRYFLGRAGGDAGRAGTPRPFADNGSDLPGRWKVRWGIGRDRYRVAPGLYALGSRCGRPRPGHRRLRVDLRRRAPRCGGAGRRILVLDTQGVNVWCAAGEGTFGTGEVIRRVREARLSEVVSHRKLSSAARRARSRRPRGPEGVRLLGRVRSGACPGRPFVPRGRVKASPAMRRVDFPVMDRLVLTPVEIMGCCAQRVGRRSCCSCSRGSVRGSFPRGRMGAGVLRRGGAAGGVLAGAVATPRFSWLPGRAFSVKGGLAGGVLSACAVMWGRGTLDAPATWRCCSR